MQVPRIGVVVYPSTVDVDCEREQQRRVGVDKRNVVAQVKHLLFLRYIFGRRAEFVVRHAQNRIQ